MSLRSTPAEVPLCVQRRAWEAAYILGDEFRPLVPGAFLWRVDAAFRAGPFRQSWLSVCTMFVLLDQVAPNWKGPNQ